jgi:hypothetical protein
VYAVAWQALVVAGVLAYAVAGPRPRGAGPAWVAPPVAALLGTALPYQLAASRLIRSLTR